MGRAERVCVAIERPGLEASFVLRFGAQDRYAISRESDKSYGNSVHSSVRLIPARSGTPGPVNVSCSASNAMPGREHRDAKMFLVEPVRLSPAPGES